MNWNNTINSFDEYHFKVEEGNLPYGFNENPRIYTYKPKPRKTIAHSLQEEEELLARMDPEQREYHLNENMG
jgi:hypothetical protein